MIELNKFHKMDDTVKNSETNLKTKISFSVESLLSNKCSNEIPKEERCEKRVKCNQSPSEMQDEMLHSENEDNEDEDITVDDDDELESRDSLSPNSGHTVIVPQPLHPSIPRIIPQGPHQWAFGWPHGNLMRSPSPQSKYLKL